MNNFNLSKKKKVKAMLNDNFEELFAYDEEDVKNFIERLKMQIFGSVDEYLPPIHAEEINKIILNIINKNAGDKLI